MKKKQEQPDIQLPDCVFIVCMNYKGGTQKIVGPNIIIDLTDLINDLKPVK